MLPLRQERLPDDARRWLYQLKLDGYRALAFKSRRDLQLRSRNNKDFRRTYPSIMKGLAMLPDETVIDGEIVALDDQGRPSFNALQNAGGSPIQVVYFVFDVMVLAGRDLRAETLETRLALLEHHVEPTLRPPVTAVGELRGTLEDLVQSVKAYGLEGLVAKRRTSHYEPGRRSGAWRKMRVNRSQEFVIGGYTIGTNSFDALVFGYYDRDQLTYSARTRSGFTPAIRADLFRKMRPLEVPDCPFVNLPEAKSGRWGEGLTKAKMAECRWLRPVLVGQFEFLEWTSDNHLRHTRFISLREDNRARTVRRE
jgi:DNA ligase D-like protein (predicted ligase)